MIKTRTHRTIAGLGKAATRKIATAATLLLLALCLQTRAATTIMVSVGSGGFNFNPSAVTIHVGDTVQWNWAASGHTTTSGTPGQPSGFWDSGFLNAGATFSHTFSTAGSFPYFCTAHGACCGMVGSVTVTAATPTPTPTPTPTATPSATPAGRSLNISTRVDVEGGDHVAIAGFIITGGSIMTPKQVVIRALGPSLGNANPPVTGALANPVLELHKPDGTVVVNDSWMTNSASNRMLISDRGLDTFNGKPIDDKDAVIVASLPPLVTGMPGSGAYTAIFHGLNNSSGVGLIEVYDLDDPTTSPTELANISTRGIVGTGNDVLIAGVIIGPLGKTPPTGATVVVRAIGPELSDGNPPVPGALADPFLELHNGNGDLIVANDNWKLTQSGQSQQAEIQATGLAPKNDLESALLAHLTAGNYTAIVSGKNNTTGVALVEVYKLSGQ